MKSNRFSNDAPRTARTATHPSPPSTATSTSSSSFSFDQQTATTSSESTRSSIQETSSLSNSSLQSRVPVDRGRVAGVHLSPEEAMTTNNDNESILSSSISVKQYKNSPFGLNSHYLTMPDSDLQSSKILNQHHLKRYNDIEINSHSDNESLGRHHQVPQLESGKHRHQLTDLPLPVRSKTYIRHNWRKANAGSSASSNSSQLHDLRNVTATNNQPDLSPASSGPSSFSPIKPWLLDYNNKQQHHDLIHSSQPKLIGPHKELRTHDYLAASDAGLDAKKCNAKDKSCYHEEPENSAFHLASSQLPAVSSGFPSGVLQPASDSSGLLVRFSSIMYATFLVILGCILHVSELRQKSKNSSDHIYTTIVALVGILWLMFLQTDLQRYKRYASKYILIETIFNDHKQKQLQQRRSEEPLGLDPTARSTTSSSASLVNDRMSMNTEVIFKKTAYKMYQRRAALDYHRQMNESKQHKMYQQGRTGRKFTSKSSSYSSNSHHPHPNDLYKPANSSFGQLAGHDMGNTGNSDCLVPAYKFLHGKMGANFYLKCGMAAFCFGHVIHEGLRFGQQVYFFGDNNVHCRDSAALVAHLVTPLYSFYQLFMMFKYSNLVINRHKVLARFGLMHIIGTSVTFWFRTILEEAFEDFVHKMDYFKTNKPHYNLSLMSMIGNETHALVPTAARLTSSLESNENHSNWNGSNQTDSMAQSLISLMSSPLSATITPQLVKHLPESYACAHNTLLTTKSMNTLPYLYPFTIEYNLLLAATFLSLYFNIGKIGGAGLAGDRGGPRAGDCRPIYSRNYIANNMQKPVSVPSSGSNSQIESSDTNSSDKRIISRDDGYEQEQQNYRDKELGEYKSNFVVNADCHSANKGLFCGFFVLLVTLVTIVIFFVTINKPTHVQLGIKINLIQEATLTALLLIVTLAGFKQVVKLNRNPYLKDKVTTDDVLMLIPLPFFFIHSLLSFRAETAAVSSGGGGVFSSPKLLQATHHQQVQDSLIASNGNLESLLSKGNNINNNKTESRARLNTLFANEHKLNGTNSGLFVDTLVLAKTNRSINNNNNNNDNNTKNAGRGGSFAFAFGGGSGNSSQIDHFKLIAVGLNLIVMIEVLVQTNFIIDGMRRCSESRYLRFKKPGRELITFAIILNITYWIVATFETKSVEQYKTEIEYYGPLPYMFISHTTLPVMLFYRYHSSVCLAEIWNRAYKPPKKR